ncbi:MAG TPA: hypothetical protein VKY92_14755 [Verrucomicrobiae bacterium]|nr:hypothetical protein [Verrucomicrobiae bacterium]
MLTNAVNLSASPAQHPRRTVGSYTIDLTPLCTWWSKHQGPRPLSAWVHITGSITGTNEGAWIVEARVDGNSEQTDADKGPSGLPKILLQNPPVEDLVEFEDLNNRLSELLRQRASAAGEASDARMRQQAITEQQKTIRRNALVSRLLAEEEKQLKDIESAAQEKQKNLDQQIKDLKAKLAVYPALDHYEVDCFALDLHYDVGRVAVYDHGQIVK